MTEYSEKNINNSDEEDLLLKPKKIVFHINPENIKYIESLTYQEKHDLINQLITDYQYNQNDNDKQDINISLFKKVAIIVIAVLIGIPLLLYLAGLSLDLTKANYLEMQKKFEKLF